MLDINFLYFLRKGTSRTCHHEPWESLFCWKVEFKVTLSETDLAAGKKLYFVKAGQIPGGKCSVGTGGLVRNATMMGNIVGV